MGRVLASLLAVFAATVALWVGPTPAREVENVAAFARLYGVARYFYPSDAAAELDRDRFAVHGVGQVRYVTDPSSLRHLPGVTPDVPVAPTIEDVRAGRDPVLERALTIARGPR